LRSTPWEIYEASNDPRSNSSSAVLVSGFTNSPAVLTLARWFPTGQPKSISAEDTFEHDLPLAETEPMIRGLAEKVWAASRKETRIARTVVLKLKTTDFKILTRSHTPSIPPSTSEELTEIALHLREKVDLGPKQRAPHLKPPLLIKPMKARYRVAAQERLLMGGEARTKDPIVKFFRRPKHVMGPYTVG